MRNKYLYTHKNIQRVFDKANKMALKIIDEKWHGFNDAAFWHTTGVTFGEIPKAVSHVRPQKGKKKTPCQADGPAK